MIVKDIGKAARMPSRIGMMKYVYVYGNGISEIWDMDRPYCSRSRHRTSRNRKVGKITRIKPIHRKY